MAPLAPQTIAFAAKHVFPRVASALNDTTTPILTPPAILQPSTSSQPEINIAILATVFTFGTLVVAILQFRRDRARKRVVDEEAVGHEMTPIVGTVERLVVGGSQEAISHEASITHPTLKFPGDSQTSDQTLKGSVVVEVIEDVRGVSQSDDGIIVKRGDGSN